MSPSTLYNNQHKQENILGGGHKNKTKIAQKPINLYKKNRIVKDHDTVAKETSELVSNTSLRSSLSIV